MSERLFACRDGEFRTKKELDKLTQEKIRVEDECLALQEQYNKMK